MKKIFLISSIILFSATANAAVPQRPVVQNITYGGVESNRQVTYQPPYVGEFYLGARGAMNLVTFSNKYSDSDSSVLDETDSFSFVRQLGFDVSAGYQFAPKWRAELNYGYTGKYEDQDSEAVFALSSQYVLVNAIYTAAKFGNGANFYIGAGAGVAMLGGRVTGAMFAPDGKDTQSATTIAGQILLGVEKEISDAVSIGAQYRLLYNGGATIERDRLAYTDNGGNTVPAGTFKAEIGGVLTNSVMLGLRIKF